MENVPTTTSSYIWVILLVIGIILFLAAIVYYAISTSTSRGTIALFIMIIALLFLVAAYIYYVSPSTTAKPPMTPVPAPPTPPVVEITEPADEPPMESDEPPANGPSIPAVVTRVVPMYVPVSAVRPTCQNELLAFQQRNHIVHPENYPIRT